MRQVSSHADDELMLVGFSGEEAMSLPGGFSIDLCSPKATLAAKDFLRKPLGVVIESADGSKRHIQGLVRRFSMTGQSDDLTLYRAEIVPWLWFLTLSSDCKIFQNLTVPQILEEVFKSLGFTDFDPRLLKTYPKREYCVQYRESHFNFVSRLMEDEGIFYFFEHDGKKHTLILADNTSKVFACPGVSKVTMRLDATVPKGADALTSMQEDEQVSTGVVTYNDFNFLQPKANLLRSVSGKSKEELYEYPGGYEDVDGGDRYAGLTLEEFEAAHRTAYGSGTCRSFTAGHKFTLTDHARKEMNTDWTLLRVAHSGHNAPYRGTSSDSDETYNNSFVAMPHSVIYRPPAVTPRPRMRGTQTATVVGKAGEEIWTDKNGRVKVQFHWDRHGKKDENSSCWVRVSTPWSGKNWGMVAIPRMNQEVVVDFLEGDPDQPIIIGMVYNADFMPPWDLPANQTQSGILTRSTKGGAAANANGLRFEDKKGAEQVWLHAEKNQDIEVENDETHWVGHDRKKTIDNDEIVLIKHDHQETVNNDQTLAVDGKQNITIKKDQTTKITEGNQELVISQGDRKTTLAQGKMETILDVGDQTTTLKTGNQNTVLKVGNEAHKIEVGNVSYKLGVGNFSVKCDAGGVKIESLQGIELKCGSNSIKIDMMGVTIKGLMVKVEADVQASIKGTMTEVKGDAMLQAKGAITMIG
jgi:type VI secretion system secreted protein VgrG